MQGSICVLCGVQYEAPAGVFGYEGLCPDHWSRDTLREYDRIISARRQLAKGSPATLKLSEWLAIVGSWRGLCALCQLVPYSLLAIWRPDRGLIAGNVVPLCKVCNAFRGRSFDDAMRQIDMQLTTQLQVCIE